jgi:peptide/nickel transport system permease protein
MGIYILKRLLGIIPILFGITLVSFFIIHLAPGKPSQIEQSLNPKVSSEVRLRLEKAYGLDKPLHIQYFSWLGRIVRLDFGRSFVDNVPVVEKIAQRIPLTLTINILSLALILLIAIPIGVLGAVRAGTFADHAATVIVFLFFSVPSFWLALLLMQLVCIHFNWFPISGIVSLDYEYFSPLRKALDVAWHLFLPVTVSALAGFAGLARYVRANMIEVLGQPYIYTARAKGLPERDVIYRHALRNALLPVVTILGLSIPGLLGGSVLFESVFALPGIGRLFYEAVMTRDYPLIMAEVVLGGVLTMLGNLIADISYAAVDPRVRVGAGD